MIIDNRIKIVYTFKEVVVILWGGIKYMYRFGYLATFAIVTAVIGTIIGIAFYVFYSYALYRLAQKRNVEMPWLAWIPVVQMYIVGKMVKTVKISNFEVPSLEIVLPVATLVNIVLSGIPVLGVLISLVYVVLLLLTLYNLYMQYVPDNAVVYAILSIIVIPIPFLLLKLAKMDPVNPA